MKTEPAIDEDQNMEEDEDFYSLDSTPRVTVYQLPVADGLCSHEVGGVFILPLVPPVACVCDSRWRYRSGSSWRR